MQPKLTHNFDRLTLILRDYAAAMEKTAAETTTRAARGVVKRALAITPPASQGTSGAAAFQQGKLRIAHQLSTVLIPKTLKGQRTYTLVFGRKMESPVTRPTKERFPDVAQLYRDQTRAAGGGRLGVRLNNPGARFYVDQRKFIALLNEKQARVGLLASLFNAAAEALGVPVPAWVARHGAGRSHYQAQLGNGPSAARPYIVVGGRLPAAMHDKMLSLFRFACEYQRAAMVREMRHYLAKKARESGLRLKSPEPPAPALE